MHTQPVRPVHLLACLPAVFLLSFSKVQAQPSVVFQRVGACDTATLGNWLDVEGALAYVSTLNGLAVVDISNPRSPECVDGLDIRSAWEIDVEADHAYMLAAGVVIADIGREGEYGIEGSYVTSSRYTDVKVKNQYMFLTALKKGLEIVDVSNPRAPTAVSHFYETTEYSEEWMGYMHLDVHGDLVYVGESEHGLRVIDVSDIENPVNALTLPFETACTEQHVPMSWRRTIICSLGHLKD